MPESSVLYCISTAWNGSAPVTSKMSRYYNVKLKKKKDLMERIVTSVTRDFLHKPHMFKQPCFRFKTEWQPTELCRTTDECRRSSVWLLMKRSGVTFKMMSLQFHVPSLWQSAENEWVLSAVENSTEKYPVPKESVVEQSRTVQWK